MEKQRSFSIKPTRFLFFSFTISSSIIFLIFFSIWVIKLTPPTHQETQFHFNKSSLALSSTIQTLVGLNGKKSASEVKDSILIGTHFSRGENASKTAEVSSFDGVQVKKSDNKVAADEVINKGVTLNSNLTSFTEIQNFSVNVVDNSVLIAENSSKPENSTDFAQNLAAEEPIIDGLNSSFTSRQQDLLISEASSAKTRTSSSDTIEKKNEKSCDVTKGKWVFDESYPLYTNVTCPFIDEGFNCEANGRLDKDYMKWRWQPQDCDIPRFNATKMLELIRGKRLVFVGDSINRNQWESMLCLLMGAVKDPKKVYETRGRRITKEKGNYSFKFVDYKCTVEYYVTHFLVHESKARVGKKRVQTLRIDAIDKGSSRWRGADILVFNTAHWWNHHKTKAGINYYQEGDQVHPRLDASVAFRRALVTWASWVDKYINAHKTQVFFRSSAPSHFSGGQWNTGGHCKEATEPIDVISTTKYPEKNIIVEEVIRQMRTPVITLNITALSDYRIDAHPSIYGRMSGKRSGVQDCSHWCLPGVPDTWNEMLYSHLLLKERESFAE